MTGRAEDLISRGLVPPERAGELRRVAAQIVLSGIRKQAVLSKLAGDKCVCGRPIDGNGSIGFALGQIDVPRHRQQIDSDPRMSCAEVRQMRRQKIAAEPFRGTQPDLASQRQGIAKDFGFDGCECALQLLDMV